MQSIVVSVRLAILPSDNSISHEPVNLVDVSLDALVSGALDAGIC